MDDAQNLFIFHELSLSLNNDTVVSVGRALLLLLLASKPMEPN